MAGIRAIQKALSRVQAEVAGHASRGGLAGGLASEGFFGGYAAALQDVLLLLRNCRPCVRREFWIDSKEESHP